MEKIRAAVAGAGLMGRWHAHSLARAGGTVVAVCDPDLSAARRLASRCKASRVATNLEEAIEGGGIDVLHLCTPVDSHFDLASSAMARGIHVLMEKPMTNTASETERLYALAAEYGVLLCPVHQFLFQRGVRKAISRLKTIGDLRHFETTFCSAGGVGQTGNQLNKIVEEILPHPLSLMERFVPGSLAAEGWAASRPATGEFCAALSADGIGFSILISMNSRPTEATLRLRGTKGTIHIDLFHGFCLTELGRVSRTTKMIRPFSVCLRTVLAAGGNLAARIWNNETAYPGLSDLIQDFYLAISTATQPPITRQEACMVAAARDRLTSRPPA